MEPILRSLSHCLKTVVNVSDNRSQFYEYEDIGPDQFRVMTLHPGDAKEKKIYISISHHAIGQGSIDTYTAVSYVWGDPSPNQSIHCDGAILEVNSSAFEVLQRLRHPIRPSRLWMDAICINQSNVAERNHQVSLMQAIYSSALRVLIWTGKQDSSIGKVFSFFEVVAREKRLSSAEWDRHDVRRASDFINRPWFHRAWTFQELCLAKQAQILCGDYELPWDTIAKAYVVLESLGLSQSIFRESADCIAASSHFHSKNQAFTSPLLSVVLPLTRNLKATDPRDKVFAMLGLVDTSRLHNLEPDYTLSVEDVYISAARAMIVQEQGLSVFSSALGRPTTGVLPSWVPDWSVPRRTAYLYGYDWPDETKFYEINKYYPIPYRFELGAGSRLQMNGVRLATAAVICRADDLLKVTADGLDFSTDPVKAWNKSFPRFVHLHKLLDVPYLYTQTGESSRLALLRSLTANRLPETKLIREFVRTTVGSYKQLQRKYKRRRRKHKRLQEAVVNSSDNPKPSPLDETKLEEIEAYIEHEADPANDVSTFLFLCNLALDSFNYKLPRPGGSFFGTDEQILFGHSSGHNIMQYIASMMQTFLRNRVVFKTSDGLIGLGPDSMATGDQIWDILGGSVPFILRKSPNVSGRSFHLVGECYVHGIMNGEIWSTSTPNNSSVINGHELTFQEIELI